MTSFSRERNLARCELVAEGGRRGHVKALPHRVEDPKSRHSKSLVGGPRAPFRRVRQRDLEARVKFLANYGFPHKGYGDTPVSTSIGEKFLVLEQAYLRHTVL